MPRKELWSSLPVGKGQPLCDAVHGIDDPGGRHGVGELCPGADRGVRGSLVVGSCMQRSSRAYSAILRG